jgi:hypothetical protein
MTTYQLKRRAVRNFPVVRPEDRSRVNHLRRQWVESVCRLGDNWLMLKKVERKAAA